MKKSYYLFNAGRMSRKDNTLRFDPVDAEGRELPAKYLPIEMVDELYVFGSLDVNSALLNFLGQQGVSLHFFGYYENYTGSFMPKEYLLAGKMQLEQSRVYLRKERRLQLAQGFLEGGVSNMLRNLMYYKNRDRPELASQIERLEAHERGLGVTSEIDELMGVEGNCRQVYYSGFDSIIRDFEMGNRSKQPPSNEVNALISFGNMMCYTLALQAIYHTQLNPTIGFLHQPGYRRYSLALDLAEVFKPVLVDRTIFKVLNKGMIRASHFDKHTNGCYLGRAGKEIFVRAWEERINETIEHKALKKKVSYKYLVRLECYKVQKFILERAPYRPFKMNW